ncbi:DUF4134 family protein [Pedobacter foliorum]|uniref:DUF4134 family protein n=1 Tax=Pedobacter foliorum TaxID=2739058 RepID=UPI001FEAA492|nr:DUF4134 family protein [Pedobacter foliorum]
MKIFIVPKCLQGFRLLVYAMLLPLITLSFHCQGQPGIAEMQQANASFRTSFFSAFDATLVLATLLGICGAVRIYHNLQMGKNQFTAEVAAWFLAALFVILMGPFLRGLFGI